MITWYAVLSYGRKLGMILKVQVDRLASCIIGVQMCKKTLINWGFSDITGVRGSADAGSKLLCYGLGAGSGE